MTKRVAIVAQGQWGDVERARGDYGDLEDMLVRALESAEVEDLRGRKERAAEVKIVPNVKEAREWLGGSGVVVFTTRGMLGEAKKFAADFPKTRTVLFTGLIPEGEVILVLKGWLREGDFRRVILD